MSTSTPRPAARSFASTFASVADVDGWMTRDQARRLWDRAAELGPGDRIVEIGSFRGRSTIILATSAAEGVEVVAIDPHGGTDRGPQELTGRVREAEEDLHLFHDNLTRAGVDGRVHHLREYSGAALADVDGPVSLLYIDGAHRWKPASSDIRHWGGRVPEDGVMLIHDSFSSVGVTAALVTELFWSDRWRYEGRSQSMTQYRRRRLSRRGRAENALRQVGELPWFVRNVAIKVMIQIGLGRWTRFLGHSSGEWPY